MVTAVPRVQRRRGWGWLLVGSAALVAAGGAYVNGARKQVGDLILHVRDNLEEQAEAEGRTAQALWAEAIEKPGTDEPRP